MEIINNFMQPLLISVEDVVIDDVCGSRLTATASEK